jgi:outer membrane lipoprotein carrier protein
MRLIVLLCALLGAVPALAALPTPLHGFLEDLRTWRADFEQQVQDARGQSLDRGQGTVWVQRPGRFRWDYRPAGAATSGGDTIGQLLVTDGRNLWLYERDLQQATVRDAASAAGSAPLQLLSGDVAELESTFTVTRGKDHDGLQWVEVRPRSSSADFTRAELGFSGGTLSRMQISDKLGQQTTLRFSGSQRNPALKADVFTFVPPAGVDVIGTPRS